MVKIIIELALRFVVFFILIYFLTFGFTEVNPGIILTLLAILVMTVFVRVFALLRKLPAIHPVSDLLYLVGARCLISLYFLVKLVLDIVKIFLIFCCEFIVS